MCEAVKVKLQLHWRSKGVEMIEPWDISQRVQHIGCRTSSRATGKCMAVSKTGRAEPVKSFDIRHEVTGFGAGPAEFSSDFGIVFPHYSHSLPFGNGNIYFVPLYVGRI